MAEWDPNPFPISSKVFTLLSIQQSQGEEKGKDSMFLNLPLTPLGGKTGE
jgi:hypothetical protein